MKRVPLSFVILILTFFAGVYIYRISVPKITLTELSNNISFYDGRTVEIETFLLSRRMDEFLWTITDFDENPSAVTVAYFENDLIKPDFLKGLNNRSDAKQAKVLIKGKVLDNCNMDGKPACCLFRAITIEAQEVIQLAPVEDYTRPE